jgi:hypothetical protein
LQAIGEVNAYATKALDKIRREILQELRQLPDPEVANRFKGARWALLKNPADLNDKQAPTLRKLKRRGGDLWRAYALKEALLALFAGDLSEKRRIHRLWYPPPLRVSSPLTSTCRPTPVAVHRLTFDWRLSARTSKVRKPCRRYGQCGPMAVLWRSSQLLGLSLGTGTPAATGHAVPMELSQGLLDVVPGDPHPARSPYLIMKPVPISCAFHAP